MMLLFELKYHFTLHFQRCSIQMVKVVGILQHVSVSDTLYSKCKLVLGN